jgi:hypothetical protein
MKLPMAKFVLGTILVMTIVVAVKSVSANHPQDSKKARVSGTVVSRNALGGKKYSISIKLKNCKCEECKGKCSDCCIPQETIDSDENGNFQFSLGPGTYSVQVSGRDSSRIEIEVSAGESKNISLTAD